MTRVNGVCHVLYLFIMTRLISDGTCHIAYVGEI